MGGEASTEGWLRRHAPIGSGASLPDGARVGRWRIAAFIARGGAGEVYRAVDDAIDRAAALKILHRTDDAARARFAREVRALAQLRGGAFPELFETGELDGRPWYAAEFLQPLDLPKTDGAVARLIRAVCRGAGALHALGYVHRDIKPANILSRNGEPVLIDLGLLKRAETPALHPGDTISVADGRPVGVGTPGYSAPEQFLGGEISPAADIHAIGVLASECFGGHPPRAWRRIIRRATSSLPAERYPDVASLARAVRMRNLPLAFGVAAATVAVAAGVVALPERRQESKQTAREEGLFHLADETPAPRLAIRQEGSPGLDEETIANRDGAAPAGLGLLPSSAVLAANAASYLLRPSVSAPRATARPKDSPHPAEEPPPSAAPSNEATNQVPEPQYEDIQSSYSLNIREPYELAATARQRAIEASLDPEPMDYSIIESERLRNKLMDQAKNLPLVTEKQLGEVAKKINSSMVKIPGRNFEMCEFELTQELWMPISGFNPSKVKGDKYPITNVSLFDVEEFLHDLNHLPEVRVLGKPYRLPTAEEWEYACLAGGTNGFCRLADGTQVTEETLGEVAWYARNSGDKPHPVCKKKPNAFGLYDMHGNVGEWTATTTRGDFLQRIVKGNAYGADEMELLRAEFSPRTYTSMSYYSLGFRLAR